MPLQDHFHPPLSVRRHWHAFHNSWATYISSDLNRRLPAGYFAEANVQFGIEIDVAAFEEAGGGSSQPPTPAEWSPSAPTQTVPFPIVTDSVEVTIFHDEGGPNLAGAIELVSPANKDRPAHRDAFASKCQTYLQQGVGVVVVDVVTDRAANLHNELLSRLSVPDASHLRADLYAVSYRPVQRDGQSSLDLWPEILAVGQALPTMPLWLPGTLCLPVDLEATYVRTCREQRLLGNGSAELP
jgi:hypothetical protein